MMIWWTISLLGSMAVMAPAGIVIAAWLVAGRRWRLALDWCLLFGAGMALVVATKVAFIGWGIGVGAVELAGFSGHAMRAGAIFPVAFYVALKNAGARWRQAGVALGVLCAVLVGISRLVLHVHSVSEVLTGGLLGLAVAGAFIWRARAVDEVVLSRGLVMLSLCALLFTLRAEPLPTEHWMTRLALFLSGHERPFTRGDWKLAQEQGLRR